MTNSSHLATLRILTFNVWGLKIGPLHIASNIDERMRRIAEALRTSDADVVALQEVWCASIAELLIKEAGYPYHVYRPNRRIFRGLLGNGLLLLSKYPIVNSHMLRFGEFTSVDEWFAGKGAIASDIRTNQGTVRIINTHFGSGKRPIQVTRRIAQLRQFQQWMGWLEHHIPTVIAGDFNFSPASLEYCILQHWSIRRFRETLTDTFAAHHPQEEGHTYFVNRSYNGKSDAHDRDERIDYVFLLTPKQSRLELSPKTSSRILNDAARPYSDHCAVMSSVGIRVKPTLQEIITGTTVNSAEEVAV